MSTWLQDLKKKNPVLAGAYKVVGNQPRVCLRNMVRALEMTSLLNTDDDNRRLNAARYILRHTKG